MKHVSPQKLKAIATKIKRKFCGLPYGSGRWKQCRVCEEWLERFRFNRNKHNKDGLNNHCRECQKKMRRKK